MATMGFSPVGYSVYAGADPVTLACSPDCAQELADEIAGDTGLTCGYDVATIDQVHLSLGMCGNCGRTVETFKER